MNKYNNLYCSRNCKGFIILYDALGSYLLYYDNEFLKQIDEPLNPKELYKNHHLDILVPFKKFKSNENKNPTLEIIFNEIKDMIGEDAKNQRIVMTILGDLVRTIKDAFTDPNYNTEFFSNAPQYIIDIARDLSSSAGYDINVFDNIVTPASIEDEIQQRVSPILTSNEKKKADKIAKEVNEIGLLPYLDNILDNIHIGEHKNIYRKILAVFNTMRGAGSYYNKSVAKFEAGKSFEDDITLMMTPERYIFKANRMTNASFLRFALRHERYFDRMIIYLGDIGSDDAYREAKPILNIVKPLITENEFDDYVSEKENDTGIISRPLKVDSIQVVFQTVDNKTDDDGQLISRTLYFTPAIVEDKDVMTLNYYQRYSITKQHKAKKKAEQDLKDFGLYLMKMVNYNVEIINPYGEVFMDYALKSDSPKREFNHQMELFEAYCILTQDKCNENYQGTKWASLEQLKEYMDYINLENALIPYEFDFLQMIKADGKANQLTILYTNEDIRDDKGNLKKDIDIENIITLTECENYAIELMNNEYIETKADLSPNDLKSLPYKLLLGYGLRSAGANHKPEKIFFRYSDIKNIYSRYNAYRNVEDVSKLLNSLYNKGYLGKYEHKQDKENLYYLTPLCETLTSKFEAVKSFDDYATEFITNAGYENF